VRRRAMQHKWSGKGCDFENPSPPRGTTKRGKKSHFHLLDRYIRRIDSLLPEEMEDLVRPLGYKPNQEKTSRTLKITLNEEATGTLNVTEGDVYAFLEPLRPTGVVVGWTGARGESEVYAQFETNADCQAARQKDGESLGGAPAQVRYSVDNKFRRVTEDVANGIFAMPPLAEAEPEGGAAALPGGWEGDWDSGEWRDERTGRRIGRSGWGRRARQLRGRAFRERGGEAPRDAADRDAAGALPAGGGRGPREDEDWR